MGLRLRYLTCSRVVACSILHVMRPTSHHPTARLLLRHNLWPWSSATQTATVLPPLPAAKGRRIPRSCTTMRAHFAINPGALGKLRFRVDLAVDRFSVSWRGWTQGASLSLWKHKGGRRSFLNINFDMARGFCNYN